ncbi:MAG: hypothetical protein U9Q69_06050 [Nanoarchaeota archaeon]|nr:hypothetical protein [Nanoarchaeota archaeon]
MTHCNRCDTEFNNYFNNIHWCPNCGKQFVIDENLGENQSNSLIF